MTIRPPFPYKINSPLAKRLAREEKIEAYRERWFDLDQFMRLCFHEEMADDYPAGKYLESAKKSIKDFFRTQSREQVEQVYIELEEFLKEFKTEKILARFMKEIHWGQGWDFEPYRPWLKSILTQVDNFLGPGHRIGRAHMKNDYEIFQAK